MVQESNFPPAKIRQPSVTYDTNQAGLDIIKECEGLYLKAYICPAGLDTIGYGHVRLAGDPKTCTKEQAEAWLVQDTKKAETAIDKQVTAPLTENEFSALASWTFNLGSGRLQSSTLRKKLNRQDYDGAAEEFLKWVYGGGRRLEGLVKRRALEKMLFQK